MFMFSYFVLDVVAFLHYTAQRLLVNVCALAAKRVEFGSRREKKLWFWMILLNPRLRSMPTFFLYYYFSTISVHTVCLRLGRDHGLVQNVNPCIKVGLATVQPPPNLYFPPHSIRGTVLPTLALNTGIGCKLRGAESSYNSYCCFSSKQTSFFCCCWKCNASYVRFHHLVWSE